MSKLMMQYGIKITPEMAAGIDELRKKDFLCSQIMGVFYERAFMQFYYGDDFYNRSGISILRLCSSIMAVA
jgi:hypothetical protein